ncbi:MAG: hypothetical protein QM739_01495 [Propionivibrio sp.]
MPEAGRAPPLILDVGQRAERPGAVESDRIAGGQEHRNRVVVRQLALEFRDLGIHAAEERNLPRARRAGREALEELMQRKIVGHVLGHDDGEIGGLALADGTQGLIAAGKFGVPVRLDPQATVRFLFDGGKQHVLEEAGTHAAQRFVVGIAQDFRGDCRAGQQGGGKHHRQNAPGRAGKLDHRRLHGVSVVSLATNAAKDGKFYEQSFSF